MVNNTLKVKLSFDNICVEQYTFGSYMVKKLLKYIFKGNLRSWVRVVELKTQLQMYSLQSESADNGTRSLWVFRSSAALFVRLQLVSSLTQLSRAQSHSQLSACKEQLSRNSNYNSVCGRLNSALNTSVLVTSLNFLTLQGDRLVIQFNGFQL